MPNSSPLSILDFSFWPKHFCESAVAPLRKKYPKEEQPTMQSMESMEQAK
jgi:hypothetical protein